METSEYINKFVLSSEGHKNSAKYILLGVPDDSGSEGLAYFAGSAGGPDAIRKASQLYCAFHRTENGVNKTFISNSYAPVLMDQLPFFDAGDAQKVNVAERVEGILKSGGFPIVLGGDHSITYEVLRGVNEIHKKFAVIYFDAHPDFRSSDLDGRKSYGTVMYDASKLSQISVRNSIQVGISDVEAEEFENAEKAGIAQITPLEIERDGIGVALKKIRKTIGRLPVYISIDLDVLDQSFAPDVSTPSPCGLSNRELLFLLTELAKENIVGFDIMEHVPNKDGDPRTSTVGARLIIEFLVRHYSKWF